MFILRKAFKAEYKFYPIIVIIVNIARILKYGYRYFGIFGVI